MKSTVAILAMFLVTGAATARAQQAAPAQPAHPTYTWSAELASAEQGHGTVTLKVRTVSPAAVDNLRNFKPGDRVVLHWSGFMEYSDGVQDILKPDGAQAAREPFLMPAELVTTTPDHGYITIRVRVPASADTVLRSLKPGNWVTLTARHRPASDADAIVSLKAYNSDQTS